MNILAVDPGTAESGWCVINAETRQPLAFGKTPNRELKQAGKFGSEVDWYADVVAIEMVESFGMAVGREVFETCVWIGRFQEAWAFDDEEPSLVYRQKIKRHHVPEGRKVTDTMVAHALVARFAPGQPNLGKGTKAQPGWFYGFAKDVWQAYALAVYVADEMAPESATMATP